VGRPREHSDATHGELLATARRLLAEEGPRALGLRGLAARVDTSTRAVYSLFGSKENLIRALYVVGFSELVQRLRAVPRTGDPRADLLAACSAYREHARADPALYRLMCEQLVPEFEPTPADREQAFHALVDLAGVLDACRGAGLLTAPTRPAASAGAPAPRMPPLPVDPDLDLLTRQWWAVLHGLTALEIRGFLGADADAVWTATLGALLRDPPSSEGSG
jgi:AcrR family transcriptional regulator